MIIYRTKHKGILMEFAFSQEIKPTKAMILCDGLPVVPRRKETMEFLANQGFLVLYPRYRGTWESDGKFLKRPIIEEIEIWIELLKSGKIQELFSGKTFSFDLDEIFLVGVSFGGSVALEASVVSGISKIVALSPVVDFSKFNTIYPEQDLKKLGEFIAVAFPNVYRFNPKDWKKLLTGKKINPALAVKKGAGVVSKILIIQGQKDLEVNYIPVSRFAAGFGIKLRLLPSEGHFSFSNASQDIWNCVFDWLNNRNSSGKFLK